MFSARIYRYFSHTRIMWKRWKEMVQYAIPLIPNATLWWIISALNRPFMESALGLGAIGLFAVASKFPNIVASVMQIFGNSWQVSVLQEYGKQGFSCFFNNVLKLYMPLLVISSSLLALSCKWLFELFVDEKFLSGWFYSPIIALAIIAMGVSGFFGSVFSAAKQSKFFLYSSIGGAVATVALNFLLIPLFSIWGACVSFTISHFVICVLRIIYSRRFVKFHFSLSLIVMLLINIAIVISVINGMIFLCWGLLIGLLLLSIIINKETLLYGIVKIKNRVYSKR